MRKPDGEYFTLREWISVSDLGKMPPMPRVSRRKIGILAEHAFCARWPFEPNMIQRKVGM